MLETLKDRSNQKVLSVVALLLVVVTLGIREVANRPQGFSDFPAGESQAGVEIVVEEGDTGEEIARKLKGWRHRLMASLLPIGHQ